MAALRRGLETPRVSCSYSERMQPLSHPASGKPPWNESPNKKRSWAACANAIGQVLRVTRRRSVRSVLRFLAGAPGFAASAPLQNCRRLRLPTTHRARNHQRNRNPSRRTVPVARLALFALGRNVPRGPSRENIQRIEVEDRGLSKVFEGSRPWYEALGKAPQRVDSAASYRRDHY